jgi:UTP--glucose-1-phosphate uridylyltransferase
MHLTQAILPVAGLGTRFLPWTKVVPKELLPIGNKPIIAHLVDECLSAGISDICFVISQGKETIPQYFYEHPALEAELKRRGKGHYLEELKRYDEVDFHVVYQEEMKGDGHAILQAKDWVKSDTVAILFGDDLIVGEKTGLEQLTDTKSMISSRGGAYLLLEDIPRTEVSRYGVVDPDPQWDAPAKNLLRVRGLVEKPKPELAPSTFGIVGKYIIPRSTLDVLDSIEQGSHGEIRLIDALIKQLKTTDVYGCVLHGRRLDTGTPEGYKEAVKVLG